MILAYHVTLSAYGFWLPNDERGSWSDFVRRYELLAFGAATKVNTRASVAHHEYDLQRREAAQAALRFPPVMFDGRQAQAIAMGFRYRVERSGISVYACAIMPDHVHMVLGRFRYDCETMVNQLKGSATIELTKRGLHPLAGHRTPRGRIPSPWAEGLWKVYRDTHAGVRQAIRYDEQNPTHAGLRPQKWSFVTAYGG